MTLSLVVVSLLCVVNKVVSIILHAHTEVAHSQKKYLKTFGNEAKFEVNALVAVCNTIPVSKQNFSKQQKKTSRARAIAFSQKMK